MSDSQKETEGTTNPEWEVVTMTDSTYAAAPGPAVPGKADEDKGQDDTGKSEQVSSGEVPLPHHLVFPPSQHENLPIELPEPESSEIVVEKEDDDAYHVVKDEDASDADALARSLKGKAVDEPLAVEFVDQGKSMSVHDLEEDPEFGQLNVEDDGREDDHDDEAPRDNLKPSEEEEEDGAFPRKTWWRKRASCLYRQAKEANTFWSVVVAAALVGLVILGRRWHRERLQVHQLKWRSSSAVRG